MGLKDFYYLSAEYMECRACNGTLLHMIRGTIDAYNLCATVMICIMNRILC